MSATVQTIEARPAAEVDHQKIMRLSGVVFDGAALVALVADSAKTGTLNEEAVCGLELVAKALKGAADEIWSISCAADKSPLASAD